MRFRKSAHAIYKTEYHLVWIPRYWRKIFVKGVKEYAEKILSHIPELDPDIEVVKLNIQEDHVHMVVVIPPRIAVADAIQFIKTQSAKKLKAKFPFIK
jgi:putative transposase